MLIMRKMYSEDQIKEICKNKNVLTCSSKSITYTSEFKIRSVKMYIEDAMSPSQIYTSSGFNPSILTKKKFSDRLIAWRKIYQEYGEDGLRGDERGRKATGKPKKIIFKTPEEEIEYLKLRIAYKDKENDFFSKNV